MRQVEYRSTSARQSPSPVIGTSETGEELLNAPAEATTIDSAIRFYVLLRLLVSSYPAKNPHVHLAD